MFAYEMKRGCWVTPQAKTTAVKVLVYSGGGSSEREKRYGVGRDHEMQARQLR